MDKVAGDQNAATENLDVFAGPPAQIRQPVEPVRAYF
jgi:hypothetical protein